MVLGCPYSRARTSADTRSVGVPVLMLGQHPHPDPGGEARVGRPGAGMGIPARRPLASGVVEPDLATAPAASGPAAAPAAPDTARWSTADLCVRRVLGLPVDAPTASETSARKLAEK